MMFSIKDVVNFLLPNLIVSASHEIIYCTTLNFSIKQIDTTLQHNWCILHMVRNQMQSDITSVTRHCSIENIKTWQSNVTLHY